MESILLELTKLNPDRHGYSYYPSIDRTKSHEDYTAWIGKGWRYVCYRGTTLEEAFAKCLKEIEYGKD